MAGKIKMARAIKFLNQLNKLKHREGFEAYAAFIRSVEARSSSECGSTAYLFFLVWLCRAIRSGNLE